MNSGLDDGFRFTDPAGTRFHYNTPVYAITKRVLTVATGKSLDDITAQWLTVPLGMTNTAWRKRPAALNSVGNDTGLVTSPRDTAKFGAMILNRGVGEKWGKSAVTREHAIDVHPRPPIRPIASCGGSMAAPLALRGLMGRVEGPLIPAAPADLVAALGALDRRLYIVPSAHLIVVRTGAETRDPNFDQNLWLQLQSLLKNHSH
jgi:CubicO group peptidase (beta-lactamase class C family)